MLFPCLSSPFTLFTDLFIYLLCFLLLSAYHLSSKLELSISADPKATRCPLSGEKFKVFYSDKYDSWRYQDAVKLVKSYQQLPKGTIVSISAVSLIFVSFFLVFLIALVFTILADFYFFSYLRSNDQIL